MIIPLRKTHWNICHLLDMILSLEIMFLKILGKPDIMNTIIKFVLWVVLKERGQMMRPGVVKPDPKEFLNIPIFRLRLLTSSGQLVQVLYKGETPGDADIGEEVIIKGINKVVSYTQEVFIT